MTPLSSEPIGVVHYGLGPIGLEIARLVADRPALRSLAAIDIQPEMVGQQLARLTGITQPEPSSQSQRQVRVVVVDNAAQALNISGAQVVIHCTSSSLQKVFPQLMECIEAGLRVVSTCEELSYPWVQSPSLARELDEFARHKGVAVLGTGINPGFAMDYLPVVLSGASRKVTSVAVHRVQDAGTRRLPLQHKVGAGLTSNEFEQRVKAGLVRHVGLSESVQAIAAAFGWQLTGLKETIEPVLAEQSTPSGLGHIPAGYVLGVRQVAKGRVGNREVITLELEMAVGLAEPRDEVILKGDPEVRMVIPGGLHGDIATAAIVVNSIPGLLKAAPGLVVMGNMPPPHPW